MHVRGTLFRSLVARKSVHDNSGVMMPYICNDGTSKNAFGRIQRIYDLDVDGIYPLPIFEAEWFDLAGSLYNGRMPKVRVNPGSAWNRTNRYELMSKIWCQNVVFWPANMGAPNNLDFLAIYRHSENRPLDR
jgi:hypothetical protein